MLAAYACMAALAAAAPSPSPPASGDEVAPAEALLSVPLELGPPLARRMGMRVLVRRAGDDPVMHLPVLDVELPPPASADEDPPAVTLELPAGEYVLEASAPGYLPSTRAVALDPAADDLTVRGELLPDSAHRDVRFPVVGAAPAGLTIDARHLAGEQPPVRCTPGRSTCELRLLVGEWEIELQAPGRAPVRQRVRVDEREGQSVPLALQTAAPPAPPAPAPRRKLALGLGATSAPLFAGGLALLLSGRLRYGQALRGPICDAYDSACADVIIPQIHVGSAGAGALGAGAGLLAAGLTGLFEIRRATWWTELGAGLALTVGGGAWLVGNSVLLARELKSGPLADIDGFSDRRLGASFVLGAGLGLSVGAAAGLSLPSAPRRAALAPYGGPGLAGLALSGRF